MVWSQFLEAYHYAFKNKLGTENKVVDAISRRTHFLTTLAVKVTEFERHKGDYTHDKDFGKVYDNLAGSLVQEHPD